MKRLLTFLCLLFPSILLSQPANNTLVLQPDGTDGKDTYILAGSPTINYGTSTTFEIASHISTDFKRGLLQFNGLGAIPSGSTIDSTRLILTSNGTVGNDSLISIYRLTKDWDEGSATGQVGEASWNDAKNSDAWASAGGDFNATAFGTKPMPNVSFNDTTSFDITALVQLWVDGADNFGMLIKWGTELHGAPATNFEVQSSDHATAGNRPKLTIYYTLGEVAPSIGDTKTRALGTILYRGRGQELAADRNKGKVINAVKKKKKNG